MTNSLVIGGSKGIGLVIASSLKNRGDHTRILARTQGEWEHDWVPADLTNEESVKAALKTIIELKIHFNYLVFAQKNRSAPADIRTEMMVSMISTKIIVETLVPLMHEGGSVLFIGSPAGRFVVSEQPSSYHLSKAALEHYTRYCAVEYGDRRITFNCLLPATILKRSNRDFFEADKKTRDLITDITPLGIMGEDKDIANATLFFCSHAARYITGQTIFVDGGQSLVGQESLARRLKFNTNKDIGK